MEEGETLSSGLEEALEEKEFGETISMLMSSPERQLLPKQ